MSTSCWGRDPGQPQLAQAGKGSTEAVVLRHKFMDHRKCDDGGQ